VVVGAFAASDPDGRVAVGGASNVDTCRWVALRITTDAPIGPIE